MEDIKYYIGFLINGECAMTFDDETEAYFGYKRGLGFVGKVDAEGNVEPCWVASGYMDSYPTYVDDEYIASRLEVRYPNDWNIKRIKRGIDYDMGCL